MVECNANLLARLPLGCVVVRRACGRRVGYCTSSIVGERCVCCALLCCCNMVVRQMCLFGMELIARAAPDLIQDKVWVPVAGWRI